MISWNELTHEQRARLVNAYQHCSLSSVLADWRPADVETEEHQLARIDELTSPLLDLVDTGWITAVRLTGPDSQ